MRLDLSRKTLQCLLTVAMVIAFVALTTDSVTHWHNTAAQEAQCQVCHVSHASAPGPTAPVAVQASVAVERFALAEEITVDLAPHRAPSIPRAPPA
jgi:nitrous oxide reductase accessory protein NosL